MGTIEIEQFSLAEGVTREGFLAVDAEVQAWCYLHRPGLVRRTTALAEDGEVLVVTLRSGAPVLAGEPDAASRTPLEALAGAVDRSTYRRAVYTDLG